jgi:hypothetical protein
MSGGFTNSPATPHHVRVSRWRLSALVALILVACTSGPRPAVAPGPDVMVGLNDVKSFVYAWFALFDRNAPLSEFLPHLAQRGLVMEFPEATLHSRDDFARWYAGILRDIRKASHEIEKVDVALSAPGEWKIEVIVVWHATTAAEKELALRVRQTWRVQGRYRDHLVIAEYHVSVLPAS